MINNVNYNWLVIIQKKWTFLIILEAVGNAHSPISHVHIYTYGRLLTYFW